MAGGGMQRDFNVACEEYVPGYDMAPMRPREQRYPEQAKEIRGEDALNPAPIEVCEQPGFALAVQQDARDEVPGEYKENIYAISTKLEPASMTDDYCADRECPQTVQLRNAFQGRSPKALLARDATRV